MFFEVIGIILGVLFVILLLCILIPIASIIGIIGSTGFAIYASFAGIIRGINDTFDERNSDVNNKFYDSKEPAKKSWFFGPCYLIVKYMWYETHKVISNQADFLYDIFDDCLDWDRLPVNILTYVVGAIINIFHWGIGYLLMGIFSLMNLIIFSLMFVIYYLFFSLVWIADRILILLRGYKTDCPHCNERSLIPNYICPNCGEIHKKLCSNQYGIFNHLCTCGCYLGSTFLTGKGKLHFMCKHCNEIITTGATRPFVIQLLGGTSSGKTVYLSALFHEFQNNMDMHNIKYIPEPSCKDKMNDLTRYYNGVDCEATSGKDVIFYSNIIEIKRNVPRKLEIIDIPGEIFEGNVAMEQIEHRLSQYGYTDGFIFIVDPYSAGDLVNYRNNDTNTAYSPVAAEEVFNNFDRYLISQGLSKGNKVIDIPISVVITKADTNEVAKRINMEMINERFNNNKEVYNNSFDKCRDEMVKEFLTSISQSIVVNNIEARFKEVHYYIVSAMGHSPVSGVPYEPWQVFESASWIIKQKDANLYNKALSKVDK